MSTNAITATLVADIKREHEAARSALASAVDHAVRCGILLLEAKQQLPHGAWLPWLTEHFPASERTAQGYIRLARHAAKAQALAHLGVEGALKALAEPRAQVALPEPFAEAHEAITARTRALRDRMTVAESLDPSDDDGRQELLEEVTAIYAEAEEVEEEAERWRLRALIGMSRAAVVARGDS